MTDKIPIFDIPDTLLPTKKEVNKTIKRKLNQQGVRDVPDFPIDKYNAHRPEEVQEWLDENDLESDAEKLSLAYQGSARRFIQRKNIVDALRELGNEHGPIGFITTGSLEEKEFYEAIFNADEDEDEEDQMEEVPYEGFVVSEVPSDEESEDEERNVMEPEESGFKRFLELRDEPAEEFVYFTNDAERGREAKEAGMSFIWVKRYDTFDTEYDGESMGAVTASSVEKKLEKVSGSEE